MLVYSAWAIISENVLTTIVKRTKLKSDVLLFVFEVEMVINGSKQCKQVCLMVRFRVLV